MLWDPSGHRNKKRDVPLWEIVTPRSSNFKPKKSFFVDCTMIQTLLLEIFANYFCFQGSFCLGLGSL